MKERPILFSGPMVRAILDGRKTQTRRIVKWPAVPKTHDYDFDPYAIIDGWPYLSIRGSVDTETPLTPIYGKPGDRLWVKETFRPKQLASEPTAWIYRADGTESLAGWKPSIFMPRKASRITLEITNVRVERLRDISSEDAIAEGWPRAQELYPNVNTGSKAKTWYYHLWESINGKGSWDKNPWIWAISFKRV